MHVFFYYIALLQQFKNLELCGLFLGWTFRIHKFYQHLDRNIIIIYKNKQIKSTFYVFIFFSQNLFSLYNPCFQIPYL